MTLSTPALNIDRALACTCCYKGDWECCRVRWSALDKTPISAGGMGGISQTVRGRKRGGVGLRWEGGFVIKGAPHNALSGRSRLRPLNPHCGANTPPHLTLLPNSMGMEGRRNTRCWRRTADRFCGLVWLNVYTRVWVHYVGFAPFLRFFPPFILFSII